MRSTPLEAGVLKAVRGLGIPSAGQAVVVALSGGPDSVALLDALLTASRSLGFRLVAAHLDHQLRPESADDAYFCQELCARLLIPVRMGRADVRARAVASGGGVEEAARLERYAFLKAVKAEEGAIAIAVAHTRDDQAETVLLRLLRGAGRLGLGAMRPWTGELLRPLLGLSRRDVMDHLRARGLVWREDPTNADLTLMRNRVRHELIPYLERRFNPALRETLARSADVLAEESDVLSRVSLRPDPSPGGRRPPPRMGCVLSRASLNAAPRAISRLQVRKALTEAGGLRGVGLSHIDRVLDLAAHPTPSGRRLPLPGGREAVFHFDELRIGPRAAPAAAFALPLSVPGEVELPDGTSLIARPARRPAAKGGRGVVIAVGAEPLLVRTRRPGDRIRARGRDVSLKRFLMDRRVPAAERARLPLVAAGSRVMWVAGQPAESDLEPGARYVKVALRAAPRRARPLDIGVSSSSRGEHP